MTQIKGSAMTIAANTHILIDDKGTAYIDNTHTRVIMIAMDMRNGLSPEEIHAAYAYLSLSQIHAALSYYYDHQAELDAEIARDAEKIAAMRSQARGKSSQPTRSELEARLDKRP